MSNPPMQATGFYSHVLKRFIEFDIQFMSNARAVRTNSSSPPGGSAVQQATSPLSEEEKRFAEVRRRIAGLRLIISEPRFEERIETYPLKTLEFSLPSSDSDNERRARIQPSILTRHEIPPRRVAKPARRFNFDLRHRTNFTRNTATSWATDPVAEALQHVAAMNALAEQQRRDQVIPERLPFCPPSFAHEVHLQRQQQQRQSGRDTQTGIDTDSDIAECDRGSETPASGSVSNCLQWLCQGPDELPVVSAHSGNESDSDQDFMRIGG